MSLTDEKGNVLAWTSTGSLGFRGTKKSTSYAASKTAEVLAKKAQKLGINKVEIVIKGIGFNIEKYHLLKRIRCSESLRKTQIRPVF